MNWPLSARADRPRPSLRRRSSRLGRPVRALVGLVAVAALAAGCSSAGAAVSSAPTTTNSRTAFRTCLAQHGVTLPTRPPGGTGSNGSGSSGGFFGGGGSGGGFFGGGGAQSSKFRAAFNACRGDLPAGSFNRPFGGNGAGLAAFQAFRSCLADHGVKLPATGGFRSLDLKNAKVAAAVKTCRPLLPAFPRPGSSGSSST